MLQVSDSQVSDEPKSRISALIHAFHPGHLVLDVGHLLLNTIEKRDDEAPLLLQFTEAFQDLIIPQVYKLQKHANAPMIKIIEGLIEKA